MTAGHPRDVDQLRTKRLRTARIATAAFSLVNGAVFANLLPRLPEVKDAFELSNTQFGFVVIALPVGSLLAGMAPAPLLRRCGSARVAGVGSALLALMIVLAGVGVGLQTGDFTTVATQTPGNVGSAPTAAAGWVGALLAAYLGCLLIAGTLDAVVDTAQNAQAIKIQKAMRRSILNSMHALWSLGAMVGGAMGSAAVAFGLALPLHLGISGTLFAAVALVAQRFALSPQEVRRFGQVPGQGPQAPAVGPQIEDDGAPGPPPARSTVRALGLVVLISLIAIAGAMIEDLGMNWSTLFLSRVLDTPAAWAGTGLVALMAAQFIGRILGDVMTDRLGRVWMARMGGTAAAVGLGIVALSPVPGVAVLGFALAGFGSATLVPSALHAADAVAGLEPGTGLTMAGWLLRAAFLTVSPFVGIVSDAVGLRLAVLGVPVVVLVAVLISGVLRDGDGSHGPSEHAAESVGADGDDRSRRGGNRHDDGAPTTSST